MAHPSSLRCLMLPSRKICKITEILRVRNNKGMHAVKVSRSPEKTNRNLILSPTIYPRLIQLRPGLLEPLKSIPGATGALLNENYATTTPATKHRTEMDPQGTVPLSQKGTPENQTSDTGIFIRDEQLQNPVSADGPGLNHRGDLDSSGSRAGTKATDYATVSADRKLYDLIKEDAQLQVISEEICSTIVEGGLSELLGKALGASLLSAFSTLPTWR